MTLVESYVLRVATVAFLAVLTALTAVVWLSQAMRTLDLVTMRGQSFLLFLEASALVLPSLIVVIAPMALFVAIVHALHRLQGDSELVVMNASGLAPTRLGRPFALLIGAVAFSVAALSLVASPLAFTVLRELTARIGVEQLAAMARDGEFVRPERGFVFHYRERGPDGQLLGLFIQDRRDPDHLATYIADTGSAAMLDERSVLVLESGSVQRQDRDADGRMGEPAIVTFERFPIDLGALGDAGRASPGKPRERATLDLLARDPTDRRDEPRLRVELHERFVAPLYCIAFGLVGFAALCRPASARGGQGRRIVAASLIVLALRIAGFGAAALARQHENAILLAYAFPVATILLSLSHVVRQKPAAFMTRWGAARRAIG